MARLLYEQSTAYGGHLIIPFLYQCLAGQSIFSYRLLSEWGYKGSLHRAENPAGLYSCSSAGIIQIAKEHLDIAPISHSQNHPSQSSQGVAASSIEAHTLPLQNANYFRHRYTYRNHLLIIFHARHKFFYDHYPPTALKNIAAPKIFSTQRACLTWIKNSIDASLSLSESFSGRG